jgi:WD40 repeat protein
MDISADVPSTTSPSSFIITTSKDSFLKVWDLSTQHCVQTTIAHHSEVWSLDISPDGTLIFTGSNEGEMKVWRVDSEALSEGLKENESGEAGILSRLRPSCCLIRAHRYRRSSTRSLQYPSLRNIASLNFHSTPISSISRFGLTIALSRSFGYGPRRKSAKNGRAGKGG